MSKYTTEVRFICEQAAGLTESAGYDRIDNILDSARGKIFDFDFPLFDENYRVTLENKILKHYYTREIGAESVGLWKHWLCTRMNEIMPYYNQLYKSAVIEFNPMYDVDLTTDYQKVDNGNRDKSGSFSENGGFNESGHFEDSGSVNESGTFSENGTLNETNQGEQNSTGTTSRADNTTINNTINTTVNSNSETNIDEAKKNDHWEYFSDTPEGGINGVEDLSYLTNATHITDDGSGSNSTTANETTSTTVTTNNTTNNYTSNESKNNNITNENEKNATNSKSGTTGKEITNSNEGDNSREGTNEKAGSNTSNEVIRNTEDYLHHVIGKTGGVSYSKLLKEYRETFINIDMMIIKDLRDLFMNIW